MLRPFVIAFLVALPAVAAAQDGAAIAAAPEAPLATGQPTAPYVAPVYEGEPTLGVGLGVSTFGITVTPQARLSDSVGIRAPVGFFKLDDTYDIEGNDIDGEATSAQGALLFDLYPMGGGFRVSAGVGLGGYVVDARGTSLTVTDTATDTDYTITADYGATVEQKSAIAPMLAIGYASPVENRVQISFDLGAKYTRYGLALDTAELELDPAYDPTDINALIRDFENEADDYPLTPFASLAVAIRF